MGILFLNDTSVMLDFQDYLESWKKGNEWLVSWESRESILSLIVLCNRVSGRSSRNIEEFFLASFLYLTELLGSKSVN